MPTPRTAAARGASGGTKVAGAPISRARRTRRTRRLAAGLTVLLAVVTVASALSRPLRNRMELLLEVLPFPVLHATATTAVFAGVALAMAARGLRYGHRLAWIATITLLCAGAGLNLVKGLDVEEALISAALAAWLATRRGVFSVLPTKAQTRQALVGAAGAAAAAVATAIALTFTVGRRHHPRAGESIRAVVERLGGDTRLPLALTPALEPMMTAIALGGVVVGLWLLLSPRWALSGTPADRIADRERARAVISRYGGGTLDYFALRDDKDWFFTGDSVVAYAARGGVCLVSPDPIGPTEDHYQAWSDFTEFTESHGWAVVVVGAAADWRPVYEHTGLRCSYLGDEAVVDVASFTLAGAGMKSLRQAVGRVERAGIVAEFIDPAAAPAEVREGVLAIAGESRHGQGERGFSMTLSRLFDPADTDLLLVTACDATGRVLGFVQWVPAADLPGWSLDVMRRDTGEDVPNGVMDFLIVKTLEHAAVQGARGLGLNFAVLRQTMAHTPEGLAGRAWRSVLDVAARHSQLESLGRFNEKYHPTWVPRYVARGTGGELAGQGIALAQAEGLVDVPVLGRRRR